MSPLTTRLRALAGATLAAGVTAATLAVAPTASAAAPAVPDLRWNVSEQFVSHLFLSQTGATVPTTATGTASGGATYVQGDRASTADDHFTFGGGTSTTTGGLTTRTWTGTVRGAFVNGGNEYYSVTIADPSVVVDASGDGQITATVSSSFPGGTTAPATVTVAGLTGATVLGESVRATPDWDGVMVAGSSEATALGIAGTQPLDGRSFHPEFLGALGTTLRSHFYASVTGGGTPSAANPKKAPGAIAPSPTVAPTVTSSSYAGGLVVKVEGVGFNPATNPGDSGVYAAFGPSDAVIDFDDRTTGTAALTKVDWIDPARFTGDRFSTVLVIDADKLDPSKAYSIYTWQAHTHSGTSQDTRTPVAIDWSTLRAPAATTPTTTPPAPVTPTTPSTPAKVAATVRAKLVKKPSRSAAGRLVATFASDAATTPTGKARVVLKRGKARVKAYSVQLDKRGRAVVRLPKARPGRYQLVLTWAGDAAHTKARKVVTYRVR